MEANLRHVILDLDGTLCYYGRTYEEAAQKAFEEHHPHNLIPPPEEEYYTVYRELYRTDPRQGYEELDLRAFAAILGSRGVDDPQVVRAIARSYRRIRDGGLRLYPEVPEVLESLRGDFSLGLITNGPKEVQRRKVKLLGLEDKFETIVVSGEVGVEKPDPGIFRDALARLGAEPGASAHIGDSLVNDVAGANGVGMFSVWVNRGGQRPPPGGPMPRAEVLDLSGLPALLANGTSGTVTPR